MGAMLETIENTIIQEPEAEAQPGTAQPDGTAMEAQLTEEISTLWSSHVRLNADRKATSKELRQIRASLAERLHAMKSLLSRPGRGGQWRGWLRQQGIPRSTADRLCAHHAETLGIRNEIAPSGAINLGENAVEQLVQSLLPRLKRNLPDTQSVFRFLAAVGQAFGLKSETTEDCIMVSQPTTAKSKPSPSATGAPQMVSAEVTLPGMENSSDGIVVQADTAETNGGSE